MIAEVSHHEMTLVLLAHPDDEFALFPWLLAALHQGRQVAVAWLTDGGWGGQPLEPRRLESIAVLTRMGLAREKMHFLGENFGIADGSLMHQIDDAVRQIKEIFGQSGRIREIWMPAWEGGHPDHDATHLVGLKAAISFKAETYQFPLYNGWRLRGPWFRVMKPLPANGRTIGIHVSVAERVRCVFRCSIYRSQWKSFLGLLPFYILALLKHEPFVFQRCSIERINAKPHEGLLLYERRGGPTWSEFNHATADIRRQILHGHQRSSESIQNGCQLEASYNRSSDSP